MSTRLDLPAGATAGMASWLALGKAPAFAQKRELTFLSWNHFVPASDEELRKQAEAFGKVANCTVRVDTMAHLQMPAKVAADWHVTLPLIKPVLAVVILFSTIFTFGDFNIVQVLTRGGPINTTHLFATLAYQVGLNGGNLGQGAAISLFIFPLLALVVFFQLQYVRRD